MARLVDSSLSGLIGRSYVPPNSMLRAAGNPFPGMAPNLQGIPALEAVSGPVRNNEVLARILARQEAARRTLAGSMLDEVTGNPLTGTPARGTIGTGAPAGTLARITPESIAAQGGVPLTDMVSQTAARGATSADDLAYQYAKATAGTPASGTAASLTKLAQAKNAVANSGGFGKFFSGALSATIPRAIGGGVTGLIATPAIGYAADQLIGGKAEDPGFSWGGLGKALLAGGGGGALAGAVAGGGAGALPGALLGGLLSGGSYLLSEKSADANYVDTDEQVNTLRSFANEYNIDPTLADQVVGEYEIMARVYREMGQDDKLKDLTAQSMQSLAGLIGQRTERELSPEQMRTFSNWMLDDLRPFYDQIAPDSPYKVAALQTLGNIPGSLTLQAMLSQRGQNATEASVLPAAGAAGLDADALAQLEREGVKL